MSEKAGGVPTPADFFGWLNQMMNFPANLAVSAASASASPNAAQMPDPLATWKNFTEKNEETWAKFMQQMVATPEFAQALGSSANNTAAYKMMVKQTAKAYLESAGMPSRDDLTQLAEQVVSLDAKVDDLNDAFTDNLSSMPQLMGRVVATLESLATRLERLEAKMLARDELAGITQRLETLESKMLNRADLVGIGERIEALEGAFKASRSRPAEKEEEPEKFVAVADPIFEPEAKEEEVAKPKRARKVRVVAG